MGPLSAAWPAITEQLLIRSLPPVDDLDLPDDLRERAEAERDRPWPTPLASGYARYFRDGDRVGYETIVWEREYRVTRAAVMAAATGDEAWLDEAADGVTLLCEQSSWCWPAHDDTFRRHGAVVPTVTDPFLDLGAGEVAGQLAWLDHLLGDRLDARVPGLRARIRHEVDRRVLTPFETRRDWHWLGLDGHVHNWNPWIHSNVLVAALRLVDDPARRVALIALVVDGLDRYAASLPADGAIDEGYSYWWFGAGRLFEALDLLTYASGGALSDEPFHLLREVVAFPYRVHLGGDWYLNHADGKARPPRDQPWDTLHRAARRVGDAAAAAHALAHRALATETHGLGNLLRALTDREWTEAIPEPPSPPPVSVWFPSTQVLIARSGRLTLAVKGGHNGENHNHNDLGSFVVALGGVPILIDPGRPTYTAQTFGPRRYEIWTMQSAWHNTPTIRGEQQLPGPEHTAEKLSTGSASIDLELAPAYRKDVARSWRRTARLDHDMVVVRDEWDLVAGPGRTLLHLVVAGEVTTSEGSATIAGPSGTLRLDWDPAVPCEVVVRELDDPQLSDVWGTRLLRLDLDVTALGPIGSLDLLVKEQLF